jgi:hypothetical protein
VLVAALKAPSVAVSVYVPALLIAHPVNAATPEAAGLLSPPVQLSVAVAEAPLGRVRARDTVEASLTTVLPVASSTVTTAWTPKADPAVAAALGSVVNASRMGVPAAVTTNE